jgi:hypothetical protein
LEAASKLDASGMLSFAFVLATFLTTVHLADDVVRNEFATFYGPSSTSPVVTIFTLVLVLGLYGVGLVMRGRRRGYLITLVLSFLYSFIAISHMTGYGDVPVTQIATASGVFFVWVVIAMGVTSISSFVLSVYGLTRKTW